MRPITQKELICKGCAMPFVRSGYNQKYCGRQLTKGNCSYIHKTTSPAKNIQNRRYIKTHSHLINSPTYKFKQYNRSAWRRGLRFELTFEEFMEFWQRPCSYCGSVVEYIGLDRVDNDLGYIAPNIVSCCGKCNYMKGTLPRDEFFKRCRQIVRFVGE